MSANLDPLLEAIRTAGQSDEEPSTRLATVTGSSSAGVLVRFDGETSASTRAYKIIAASGPPAVGWRVVMLRVGSTWVCAGTVRDNFGEFLANSGVMASGAESADITVTYSTNLPSADYVVAGHLEDGSWADHVGWRVTSRFTGSTVFKFRNNGPNTAQAFLRFRLLF